MTKRQARNAGHKAIFIEDKSHQETFNELRDKTKISGEELAKILSQIPSRYLHEKTRSLWIGYIAILCLILIFRALSAFVLVQATFNGSPKILLLLLLLGVLIPTIGIFGAYKGKMHLVTIVPVLILLHFFRSITKSETSFSVEHIVFFVFVAVLGILAYRIYVKWKTPFKKRVIVVKKEDGREVKQLEFTFDEVTKSNEDLLDASLN